MDLSDQYNYSKGLAYSTLNMGFYSNDSNKNEAISNYNNALDLFRKIESIDGILYLA